MTTAQELSEKTNRARTISVVLEKAACLYFFSKFLLLLSLAMLNIVNTGSWDFLYCAGRAVLASSESGWVGVGGFLLLPIKHGL